MTDTLDLITIAASLVGIAIFGFALHKIKKINQLFPAGSTVRRNFQYLRALIIFFLLGYVAAIVAILLELEDLQRAMVPLVYLLGAVFVVLIVDLSYRTYLIILDHKA